MLGALKPSSWKWTAFGKHPVARDYFSIGAEDPLFSAFSGWIDGGYRRSSGSKSGAEDICAWRFFIRGGRKDALLFGIVRDSVDALGRPYPLVLMGLGHLADCFRHYDLLPFALETPWERMEYLAAKRYFDFSELTEETGRLPLPAGTWPLHQAERKRREAPPCDRTFPEREENAPVWRIFLSAEACRDVTLTAASGLSFLKAEDSLPPNAVFLGGSVTRSLMVVFTRPLTADDFLELWSIGADKKGAS